MGQYFVNTVEHNASIKHFIHTHLFEMNWSIMQGTPNVFSFQIIYPSLINITNKCLVIPRPYLHNMNKQQYLHN